MDFDKRKICKNCFLLDKCRDMDDILRVFGKYLRCPISKRVIGDRKMKRYNKKVKNDTV